MTVVNHEARNQYSATNNQTVFNYTFEIADQSNIQIFQRAASAEPDDVADLLVYGVDYTLTGVGGANGGTFILTTGATTGDVITAQGNAPAERDTSFTPGGVIQAANLNTEFDNDILIYQTILAKLDNLTPKYAKSAFVNDVDLVLPVLGENQFWSMNGDRTAIEALDVTSVISGGTVTQINTGLGLTGGPITNAGTISFAAMAANTFWGNITGGSAVPTEVTTAYFAQTANNLSDLANVATARTNLGLEIGVNVQAYSAALTSIAGLTTVSNNLIYTTASNVYAALAPVANRALVSGLGGAISWNDTLPQAVQTNITYLGEQNQNFDMGGFQINDMAEPIQPSDAATKNYVDLNALTGTSVYAASAASLGTVTQAGSGVGATLTNAGVQAVFALDGVNPPAASVVLIKNTAVGMTDANEGIYTVTDVGSGATNWVLTRATTYDTPTEINQTGLIIIQNGSTLAGTAWYNAATIVTVDTTSFSYSQFGNIIFPVSLANGGTNANLVASAGSAVYSTGTAMAFSAVGSNGQLFQSTGVTAPGWTTATYPSVATSTGSFIYADGTNFVASTSLWPNTVGTSGKIIISDGTSNIYSTSLWPNTVGSAGKIIRSDGTTNAYSTATFADTYTASNLLYSNGANAVVGLATGNNGILVTSAGGVPSISSTLPSGLTIPGYAASGANSDITSMSGLTGSLKYVTKLVGPSNEDFITFNYTGSAVNFFYFSSSTTGNPPTFGVSGSDTNIAMQLDGQGTGGIKIKGTGTNDSAATGYVGEYITSNVPNASAVSLSPSTSIKNITSISLTAGDWDVYGNVFFNVPANTSNILCWTSTTSATSPNASQLSSASNTGMGNHGISCPFLRVSISSTTTVYLSAQSSYTGSAPTASGSIYARRVR